MPDEAVLIEELKAVRKIGVSRIGELALPELGHAARASGRVEPHEPIGGYVIERLLRDAVVRIGGERQEQAEICFGLADQSRGGAPPNLRRLAAEWAGISAETFRTDREPILRRELANQILAEVHTYRLRLAQLRRDVRTPVGSRLAVEWLSRFEAMYAIWTPLTGVGGELTAYRSTLLEVGRPWDLQAMPDEDGLTQEEQAGQYVTFAIYHFARFLVRLRDFQARFGGLWLAPDAADETNLANAAHRAVLASPNTELDDSLLRKTLRSASGEEMVDFFTTLATTVQGQALHDTWLQWSSACSCEWDLGQQLGREHFPTHVTHPSISDDCDLHGLVEACNDYCLTLDASFDQIADWYQDTPDVRRDSQTAEGLMAKRSSVLPNFLAGD